jgi:hypothetical protein
MVLSRAVLLYIVDGIVESSTATIFERPHDLHGGSGFLAFSICANNNSDMRTKGSILSLDPFVLYILYLFYQRDLRSHFGEGIPTS